MDRLNSMRRDGFSILEMVIVLLIVSLLLTITFPKSIYSYQRWEQQRFWQGLQQHWQMAQTKAMNLHQTTFITYDMDKREINFSTNNVVSSLKVPKTLKVYGTKKVKIHTNGYIRPCSWRFRNELDSYDYVMKIQMAGGGYRIEKVRIPIG